MKRVLAASCVVLMLAGAACGKDDNKKAKATGASTSSTAPSDVSTSSATGASGGASATTAKGGAATATTANRLRTATGATVAPSATVKPPAAGVYTYDNTGESSSGPIPPTTKLTVSQPEGARQKSVAEEKDSSGNGSTTTQVLEYRDDGLYLVSLTLENKSAFTTLTFDFSPPSPVLFAPLPASPGKTWTVDLSSTDGCYTAHADAKVVANNVTVQAAGAAQKTDQVQTKTHIKTTSKSGCTQIDLNQDQTIWFSEQYRLSVKTESTSDGTAFGSFKISGHETSILRSTTPS